MFAVRDAIGEAVARARAGGGPTFVEALTYRLRGHYEGDPAKYRELSELADWKAKDPIAALRRRAGGLEAEPTRRRPRARASRASRDRGRPGGARADRRTTC